MAKDAFFNAPGWKPNDEGKWDQTPAKKAFDSGDMDTYDKISGEQGREVLDRWRHKQEQKKNPQQSGGGSGKEPSGTKPDNKKKWTKGEWETYKKQHPNTKIEPKFKKSYRLSCIAERVAFDSLRRLSR
jgi:hypothetical protein